MGGMWLDKTYRTKGKGKTRNNILSSNYFYLLPEHQSNSIKFRFSMHGARSCVSRMPLTSVLKSQRCKYQGTTILHTERMHPYHSLPPHYNNNQQLFNHSWSITTMQRCQPLKIYNLENFWPDTTPPPTPTKQIYQPLPPTTQPPKMIPPNQTKSTSLWLNRYPIRHSVIWPV